MARGKKKYCCRCALTKKEKNSQKLFHYCTLCCAVLFLHSHDNDAVMASMQEVNNICSKPQTRVQNNNSSSTYLDIKRAGCEDLDAS